MTATEAEGKRGDILRAAQELFGRVGYEKTGVREIAEMARVAPATIYAHFGGKEAVLEAATSERFGRLVDHLADVSGDDPVEVFLDSVRRLQQELVADAFLRRLMADRQWVADPRLRERGRQVQEAFDARAIERLRQLEDDGLVRCDDPEAVVSLVRSATQGWMVAETEGVTQVDHDRLLDVVLKAVRALISVG